MRTVSNRHQRDDWPRIHRWVQSWALWSIVGRGRALLLSSELLAAIVVTALLARSHPSGVHLARFVALAVFSIGYAEAADRVERVRRYLGSDKVWANEASVWAIAGALVLPAGYAGLLVVVIYAHTLILGRRHRSTRPYRVVFGCATVIYGTLSASVVVSLAPRGITSEGVLAAPIVGGALIAYTSVSLLVMVVGAYLATAPPSYRTLLPGRDEITFEATTLLVGVVAAAFITTMPWLTPSVLVLLAVLHRSTLVKQLQVYASTDARTGLLNPVIWQQVVENTLLRRSRSATPAAVLLLDLDHFKNINDQYGHQTGDYVIHEVAEVLKNELRGYDAVSRYGGDEFVAFLDDVDAATALAIAERIRLRIGTIRLKAEPIVTTCIGVALTDGYDDTVETLVADADAALYRAKADGRNQIHSATRVIRQEPLPDQ